MKYMSSLRTLTKKSLVYLRPLLPYLVIWALAFAYLWEKSYIAYLELQISNYSDILMCEKVKTSQLESQLKELTSNARLEIFSKKLGLNQAPPSSYVVLNDIQPAHTNPDRLTLLGRIQNILLAKNSNQNLRATR